MRQLKVSWPQLNPIIVKEVRARMRGPRPYAILTFFLLVLVLAGYGIYQLVLSQARFGGTVLSAQVGQALFNGLALVELLLVVFLAPAMTSGAISGERERLTYDMLMATPLRPARILWGKLVAALSYIFLLIFAAVPVFSVVLMFGGVTPMAVGRALLLLCLAAITFGAIGLFCSALLRRTAQATVISYGLIVLLVGLTSLIGTVWGQISTPPGQPAPPQLLYLNPFSAMLSMVTVPAGGEMGGMFGFVGDLFGSLPLVYLLSPGVIYYGPNGPVVVPIYRATLICYTLLVVLLCWLSAHLVLPRRRWRPGWSDLGFALALAGLGAAAWLLRAWWLVAPPAMP